MYVYCMSLVDAVTFCAGHSAGGSGRRPEVLSEAAKVWVWLWRVRSGNAQREERCDAGSESGGEREAIELSIW